MSHIGQWHTARRVLVTGPEPRQFLQGYLTCDTLNTDAAAMALCNLQGRVVVCGWFVVPTSDECHLIVHQSLAQKTVDFLLPYARFARCELLLSDTPVVVAKAPDGLIGGAWNFVHTPSSEDSALDCTQAIENALVATRFPWLSEDNSEAFLPQSLGLVEQSAVDFNKGCYLGQEIVARAHHRGKVKRTLEQAQWHGAPPQPGERVSVRDNDATVISVAADGYLLAVT